MFKMLFFFLTLSRRCFFVLYFLFLGPCAFFFFFSMFVLFSTCYVSRNNKIFSNEDLRGGVDVSP